MRILLVCCILLSIGACQSRSDKKADSGGDSTPESTFGSIERLQPELNELIPPTSTIEVLSEGYEWTEGPVWVPSENMLLFSDIPPNSIFKWKEGEGASLFLKPAGYTGEIERVGEPGSNGLVLDSQGRLVLCQHGDRRMARLVGDLKNPEPRYETIVSHYQGKRFNSPNDAVYSRSGDLYFTDPPYGLEGNVNDPAKEIPFQGVYRLKAGASEAELLLDSLSRPNGIALSPNENKLYVANSDQQKAIWMEYTLQGDQLIDGKVFYDATSLVGTEKGLPDGLKIHSSGAVFATGPGGVWIFNSDGKVLGKIRTGEATANCAFDDQENYLYITADMYLLRVRTQG